VSTVTAPRQLPAQHSFLEYDALARARALLDHGIARVLCGPFDRLESPWLEPQGIVPQSDDGVVIARGTVGGQPAVVASIEQRFLGGAIGEISGAKIAQALRLAAADSRAGTPTAALLLLETGGVRLQEANLGLNGVAEICAAVLELRPLAPVIGVIAGETGCFGGSGIVAGLCTRLIVTPHGRIGLNGPVVIEEEAGRAEFDASDRALIWSTYGGGQRHASGLADEIVPDDAEALREAVQEAVAAGPRPAGTHRSERLDVLFSRLASLDPASPPPPRPAAGSAVDSRGRSWLTALGGKPSEVIPSVLRAGTSDAVYLAVVPDPGSPFHRARAGEVGLNESLALAQAIRRTIDEDAHARQRRAIIAVVDLPSQAYGLTEEKVGLHQTIAAAVDAYAAARAAGHPVVALVVGTALSGGFLAHGLQADKIFALDDPGVTVHAMHKAAAARVTMRTPAQLDSLARTVMPLSYGIHDWAQLGFCDGLLHVHDADQPTAPDIANVQAALAAAIEESRGGPRDLSARLDSAAAVRTRAASREVRDKMAEQW
jgi:biotin-independent malonate decarboxylase beta subunit/biotin-independent malonate decarboxylase gamma subunit